MAGCNEWFFPRGSLKRERWESVVDSSVLGWRHTGIRIAALDGEIGLAAGDVERLVVPLAGSFRVQYGTETSLIEGRETVFDGPTDVLYVGAGNEMSICGHGRVAVAEAPTEVRCPSRYMAREEVPVELRGAGRETRQVHNFGTPDSLDAAAFIVCEVITPGGNWSSYPPHKHDEHLPGQESQLEEIYYFESSLSRGCTAPEKAEAFGTFFSYSSAAGQIATSAIVHTGDIVLVPFGYHGPAAAAPEYDLYYLNVMAGPDPERVWQVSDDPQQAWIRARWSDESPDDRLPYLAVSNSVVR